MQRTDYDLLSIDEVARTVGQSVRTVRRMVRDGEFPDGFPAPKQKRWRWSVVRDWVIRQEIQAQMGAQKSDNPGQSGTNETEGQKPSSETKKGR